MEIHLSPEQEAHLFQIAEHEGKKPEQLIVDAALSLLADDEDFRHAVREGLAQADAGNFIEEEEMDARFKKMMQG
jgi:predicted transcriptional regulator